jgi:hypothetical protein
MDGLHNLFVSEVEMEGSSVEVEVRVSKKSNRLIVLDLNGLLIDRVNGKQRVKRPHLHEFLCFLLENFHVGVWSSAQRHNVRKLVGCVFGEEQRKQLLFEFDQSKCNAVKHPDPTEKKTLYKKPLTMVTNPV